MVTADYTKLCHRYEFYSTEKLVNGLKTNRELVQNFGNVERTSRKRVLNKLANYSTQRFNLKIKGSLRNSTTFTE